MKCYDITSKRSAGGTDMVSVFLRFPYTVHKHQGQSVTSLSKPLNAVPIVTKQNRAKNSHCIMTARSLFDIQNSTIPLNNQDISIKLLDQTTAHRTQECAPTYKAHRKRTELPDTRERVLLTAQVDISSTRNINEALATTEELVHSDISWLRNKTQSNRRGVLHTQCDLYASESKMTGLCA